MPYDVVIVGASVAGCAAALLYGRAGLRVALLERRHSATAYKALCGHFVLGGARPTLERLGLWERLLAAGAVAAVPSVWTGSGWVTARGGVPEAISLRRQRLDPLLREAAASTPGVDLHLGHTVVSVIERGRHVTGVWARTGSEEVRFEGRLVVGADGHRSPVAGLAGVGARRAPNERFLFWGYYRGVRLRSPGEAAIWVVDPDVAVAVPTDDDLVLLGAFPSKARLAEFEGDRLGAIERFMSSLPDAPDLAAAVRESRAVGTADYPLVRRPPAPRPGLALIGDAATASDPVPAVGCCWAFRSAEMLADATIPALRHGTGLRSGLRAYRRAHRAIDRHDRLIRSDARGNPPNPVQRAIRRAAVHDDDIAERLGRFSMRSVPVSHLLNPKTVARSLVVSRRLSGTRTVAADHAVDGARGDDGSRERA